MHVLRGHWNQLCNALQWLHCYWSVAFFCGSFYIYVANFVQFCRLFANIDGHKKAFWGNNFHPLPPPDSLVQNQKCFADFLAAFHNTALITSRCLWLMKVLPSKKKAHFGGNFWKLPLQALDFIACIKLHAWLWQNETRNDNLGKYSWMSDRGENVTNIFDWKNCEKCACH